ncbi:MAG TPA: APC family permease [Candidatus Acidoferrales bacterium]
MTEVQNSIPPASPSARSSGLRHNYLSFIEDTAQTLGVMAPTGTIGIILPLLIARAGNTTWITFSITLVAFSLILFCIYRFSQNLASAGALASFADAGLGRWGGIIAGWAYIGAMGFGVASAAPSSAYYADLFVTQITGAPVSLLRGALITSAVILVAALVAYRDIKLSTKLMLAIEFGSLAVIIAIVAFAMFRTSAWIDRPQLHLEGARLPGFQYALVFGFMTLAGFESVTALGSESTHAKRTIPKVILSCLVPIGLLYLVVIYCLVALARKNGMVFDTLNAPFDTIARGMHLASLGYLSSVGIALSYFACTLGSMNAGARVLYSMARRHQFLPRFGVAHPRNATPSRSILLLTVVGAALPVTLLAFRVPLADCVNYLTQLTSYGFISSYFLVCLALPFYLKRKNILRTFDAVIAVAALLILTVVLALSVFPLPDEPWRYLPYVFFAVVLLGTAISWKCLRGSNSKEDPELPSTSRPEEVSSLV